MAAEKVTIMVLKVDLQCYSCYKKTKKTLCKYPQVQDQIYDEKSNTVTIKVVCCSPEKIRDKLCCSGGKAIKSIEIKEPKQPEKPKEAEKPKLTLIEPGEKPKEAEKPKPDGKDDKPKPNGVPPAEKPNEALKAEPVKNSGGPGPVVMPLPAQPVKGPEPVPANGAPSVFPYIGPSYDGFGAGPYYHGYGYPVPPPQQCYEGFYGHGYGYGYGYGRVANVNRVEHYFSEEEETQTCSIM